MLAAASAIAATKAPPPPTLESPCRHYSLKLNSLSIPQLADMGLFLHVRIDGGPVLRLLLDSGAQDIVLDKHAAAVLGRTAGSSLELAGLGACDRTARKVASGTVEIGDLVLRDCGIVTVDRKLREGTDGVIPMALFSAFLIHLDVPGKTLQLDPYPPDPPPPSDAFSSVRADDRLIFLQATVNDSRPGYILLDTGATHSVISPAVARAWKNYQMMSTPISLHVGAGDTDGLLLPAGVHFRLGSRVLSADPAVVVDLSDIGRHHEFEIAGVIGYPALRRSVVTIDYRDSLLRLDGK